MVGIAIPALGKIICWFSMFVGAGRATISGLLVDCMKHLVTRALAAMCQDAKGSRAEWWLKDHLSASYLSHLT